MDRWLPWAIVLLALAVALSIAMNVAAFQANSDRVEQINHERLRNTIVACQEKSASNKAILAYLEALGARQATLERAREFFPVLTDGECVAQASRRVTPSP